MQLGATALRDAKLVQRAPVAPSGARQERALTGFAGSGLSDRFRSWRGQSGKRYVFSVFRDLSATAVPDFANAVVIAAAQNPDGTRRLVHIAATNQCPELFFHGSAFAEAKAAGATELHVHLLAASRTERVSIVGDLARN